MKKDLMHQDKQEIGKEKRLTGEAENRQGRRK